MISKCSASHKVLQIHPHQIICKSIGPSIFLKFHENLWCWAGWWSYDTGEVKDCRNEEPIPKIYDCCFFPGIGSFCSPPAISFNQLPNTLKLRIFENSVTSLDHQPLTLVVLGFLGMLRVLFFHWAVLDRAFLVPPPNLCHQLLSAHQFHLMGVLAFWRKMFVLSNWIVHGFSCPCIFVLKFFKSREISPSKEAKWRICESVLQERKECSNNRITRGSKNLWRDLFSSKS